MTLKVERRGTHEDIVRDGRVVGTIDRGPRGWVARIPATDRQYTAAEHRSALEWIEYRVAPRRGR